MKSQLFGISVFCLVGVFPFLGLAHEDVDAKKIATNLAEKPPNGLTWQQWHMQSEHGLDEYDSNSVFKLHDLRNKNSLNSDDILKLYGLYRDEVVGSGNGMGSHDNSEGISENLKKDVISKILYLMDTNNDGEVSLEEWQQYSKDGKEFPDMNVGVGHHLSFEEEYEQHHWNKYHAKDDPDVNTVHREDIEHELLHHEHELEHGHNEDGETGKIQIPNNDKTYNQIHLENIPFKFKAN
ncbi:hypothetical protein PACTADRAFT_49691 [Pachysolen tannophilus NRRL Y-2460]|uniref:EF-hand domain-containing protein n=1 Tax=Pachysolen tannophilus NRRL Y-2460 TaxID=669874 RepID=A0A1E4TXE3_PACTA|nr:hypothetical protein PACTADRAFT_49691 [Pachysolen tannophilus NRRL Y-2460]